MPTTDERIALLEKRNAEQRAKINDLIMVLTNTRRAITALGGIVASKAEHGVSIDMGDPIRPLQ